MNRLPIDDVLPALRQALAERHEAVLEAPPVSYTHLTLPTSDLV